MSAWSLTPGGDSTLATRLRGSGGLRLSGGLREMLRGPAAVAGERRASTRIGTTSTSRANNIVPGTVPGNNYGLKDGPDDTFNWAVGGFPTYLQSRQGSLESTEGERGLWLADVWQELRQEVQADVASEPLLSSFLHSSVLAHESFEQALAYVLAGRLSNTTLLPTQLFRVFHDVLRADEHVRHAAIADLEALRERDPSCRSASHALLYFKGYHAVQSQRIAHALWNQGQRVLALSLQSRMSEVFAVDIHPAARIGKGILLDHGTGVVIGETAVIGDNCSILQNVTLGGTGKEDGDRHPKVGSNVLIGASASILGNIVIGEGAQIAAGSLVLKPVDPYTMVAGAPAKPVGKVMVVPA